MGNYLFMFEKFPNQQGAQEIKKRTALNEYRRIIFLVFRRAGGIQEKG